MRTLYSIPVPDEHTWTLLQKIIEDYELNHHPQTYTFPILSYSSLIRVYGVRDIQFTYNAPHKLWGWRSIGESAINNIQFINITPAQLLRMLKDERSTGCT